MAVRVAIDIGGGFADLAAIDLDSGKMYWAKTYTTPDALTQCVQEVFRRSGVKASSVVQVLHGQTLVINTILQRNGAQVGLITTRGFRDVLSLQRANRRDIFNLRYRKPEPFVPRRHRLEVDERIAANGEVLVALDEESLRTAYRALVAAGVEAISLCYLNSYANDEHERRSVEVLERYAEEHPEWARPYLTYSAEVCREWREYERTSTSVLNAYVMPQMKNYTETLARELRAVGVNGTLLMMLSNGGVSPFEYATRNPIETIESGPVAGIVAAAEYGRRLGRPNIIALDGGSTTTKASLIEDGVIRYMSEYAVERDDHRPGYPVKVPVADVMEIGVGGNSVAWLDAGDRLNVGPRNAGAIVGPAAYGRGGIEPTLTDAFIVLGYVNPNYMLGGALQVSRQLAVQAVNRIAEKLDVNLLDAAFGIVRIAVSRAVQMLRLISVQRGYDPRSFSLLAYGGSGPTLAAMIARELGIKETIISAIPPGNFSAWGLLMCDLKHTAVRTLIRKIGADGATNDLGRLYAQLEEEVQHHFTHEVNGAEVELRHYADLRYAGQEHTIRVELSAQVVSANTLEQARDSFHETHRKQFGFTLQLPVEFVNGVVVGTADVGKPQGMEMAPAPPGENSSTDAEQRDVYWGALSKAPTQIVRRASLSAGTRVDGPAVLEEATTSILIPPRMTAEVDQGLNLFLSEVRA